MGCFFGCFRIGNDNHRNHRRTNLAVSDSTRSLPREAVVSKNRLSALFLSEEKDDLEWNRENNDCLGSPHISKEVVAEAKFLKACGTLPETPSEIRKATAKLKTSPPNGKESESSDYHSWLPSTDIKKLQLDKQIEQPPIPVKLCQEWTHGSASSDQTPSSCISNAMNTGRMAVSSVEDAASVPFEKKSVRFECNYDTSSSGSGSHIFNKLETLGHPSVSKRSPKPTPLKLSDEMQTPGTVFPSSVEVLANGKPKIRSQYVHPLLNPVENASRWKLLQEDDSTSGISELKGSREQPENATPNSELRVKETSAEEPKVEESLSAWFKPLQHKDEQNDRFAAGKNFRFVKTPMDRPIIGMVAAHWNENEPTQISPKWWDGNGIPNSTNKYKEDQKVSWHATPFEERLEKALSEESFISQKKPVDERPIAFEEFDESDTALSKLQASTHSKSVVSF